MDDTPINDLKVIKPRVFEDERGFFFESFNEHTFHNHVVQNIAFVQDNHSRSSMGVLRGLHYQYQKPQGKLIRVVSGSIFDVAVDLRQNSTTFGAHYGVFLTAENKAQMWIPEGFAHGFLVTSSIAEVVYKTTNFYDPTDEVCLKWDDPSVAITWPKLDCPIKVSEKDQVGQSFDNVPHYGDIR